MVVIARGRAASAKRGRHRDAGHHRHPCREGRDHYRTYRHGPCWRRRGSRAGAEPRSSRRQRHRCVHTRTGTHREEPRAPEAADASAQHRSFDPGGS